MSLIAPQAFKTYSEHIIIYVHIFIIIDYITFTII